MTIEKKIHDQSPGKYGAWIKLSTTGSVNRLTTDCAMGHCPGLWLTNKIFFLKYNHLLSGDLAKILLIKSTLLVHITENLLSFNIMATQKIHLNKYRRNMVTGEFYIG